MRAIEHMAVWLSLVGLLAALMLGVQQVAGQALPPPIALTATPAATTTAPTPEPWRGGVDIYLPLVIRRQQ